MTDTPPRLVVDPQRLAKITNVAAKISTAWKNYPAYSAVTLVAEGSSLTVYAALPSAQIVATLPLAEQVPERVLLRIPAIPFARTVKVAGSSALTIDQQDGAAVLSWSGAETRLPIENTAPPRPNHAVTSEQPHVEIAVAHLKELLSKGSTTPLTDASAAGSPLSGVCVVLPAAKETLMVATTDGTSLVCADTSAFKCVGEVSPFRVAISAKSLGLLSALDDEGCARVHVLPTAVVVATETVTISTALIQGDYPPFEPFLDVPDTQPSFTLGQEEIARLSAALRVLSAPDSVKVTVSSGSSSFEATGLGAEFVSGALEPTDVSVGDEAVETTLSVRRVQSLLSDAAGAKGAMRVKLFGDANAVLAALAKETPDGPIRIRHIVMPLCP